MKYYSRVCNRKEYILSYKIKNDRIIIKYANRKKMIVPYNKENENLVLSIMEKQAKKANVKPMDVFDKVLAVSQPILLPVAIMNLLWYGTWFLWVMLIIVAVDSIIYPIKYIKYKSKTKELEKIKYFLDNKNELNTYINKIDDIEKSLTDVNKKTINNIKSQQEIEKPPFNINNIDNYSLNQLKLIKKNLIEMVACNYNIEERTKVIEKKKNKRY